MSSRPVAGPRRQLRNDRAGQLFVPEKTSPDGVHSKNRLVSDGCQQQVTVLAAVAVGETPFLMTGEGIIRGFQIQPHFLPRRLETTGNRTQLTTRPAHRCRRRWACSGAKWLPEHAQFRPFQSGLLAPQDDRVPPHMITLSS